MKGSFSRPRYWAWFGAVALLLVGLERASAAIVVIPPPPGPPDPLPPGFIPISMTDPRFVAAAATMAVGVKDADDSFGHFGPPPLDGVAAVPGTGFDGSSLFASALQDSTTPASVGPLIFGTGSASVTVSGSTTGSYSVTADSFFDVFFMVDLEETYLLTGAVDSGAISPLSGFPPGSGVTFAIVTLKNVTSSTVLYSEGSTPFLDPGPDPVGFSATLTTGTVYRLTAEAKVDRGGAPGTLADFAVWHLALAPGAVPEPSSFVVFAGLALATTALARRRRESGERCATH